MKIVFKWTNIKDFFVSQPHYNPRRKYHSWLPLHHRHLYLHHHRHRHRHHGHSCPGRSRSPPLLFVVCLVRWWKCQLDIAWSARATALSHKHKHTHAHPHTCTHVFEGSPSDTHTHTVAATSLQSACVKYFVGPGQLLLLLADKRILLAAGNFTLAKKGLTSALSLSLATAICRSIVYSALGANSVKEFPLAPKEKRQRSRRRQRLLPWQLYQCHEMLFPENNPKEMLHTHTHTLAEGHVCESVCVQPAAAITVYM